MQLEQIGGDRTKSLHQGVKFLPTKSGGHGLEIGEAQTTAIRIGQAPDALDLFARQVTFAKGSIEALQGKAERELLRVVGLALGKEAINFLPAPRTKRPDQFITGQNRATIGSHA